MSEETPPQIFRPAFDRYNQPGRIVTFGPYLPTARVSDANGVFRYIHETGERPYRATEMRDLESAVRWTRWINALNAERKWAVRRLFELFDNRLEAGIAIAVVPSHEPFRTDPPLRELAKALAANDRIDATGCLVRHTKIKRIVYGGPSYRSLHRQTISVNEPEIIAGQRVLLLDDIAKSGASLRACEELLYEAGAARVQAAALGRVAS
jgi:phosphoribosylpyrophosphate synthetase